MRLGIDLRFLLFLGHVGITGNGNLDDSIHQTQTEVGAEKSLG